MNLTHLLEKFKRKSAKRKNNGFVFDANVKKKILIARKYFLASNLDLSVRLFILQVFIGIKPAASFDYVNDTDLEKIVALLKEMEIDYRVFKCESVNKILFGKKDNVRRLFDIHDNVVSGSGDDEKIVEYGRLLGYPRCCSSTDLDFFPDNENVLLKRYSNIPLIFHAPCSPNCEESIELAKQSLAAYYYFDKSLPRIVLKQLRCPILMFSKNLYARFNECSFLDNKLSYQGVSLILPSPIDERLDYKSIGVYVGFLEQLKKGNTLHFEEEKVRIYYDDELIFSASFVRGKDYKVLNFE